MKPEKNAGIRKQTRKWTMKDGRKIRICDMTDSHLENTLRMLRRYAEAKYHVAISDRWRLLCSLQGEMAQDIVEQELMVLEEEGDWSGFVPPIFESLEMDFFRRRGYSAEWWPVEDQP